MAAAALVALNLRGARQPPSQSSTRVERVRSTFSSASFKAAAAASRFWRASQALGWSAACLCACSLRRNGARRHHGHRNGRIVTNRGSIAGAPEASGPCALLFDCDGVIVETEELHRLTYNLAFAELRTDVEWSEEYYDMLQNTVGGGKAKMRYHFDRAGWPGSKLGPPPATAVEMDELVDTLQERKTEIYGEKVAQGALQARPGIVELIDEAHQTPGLRTAICSAATKASAQRVLFAVLGEDRMARFDVTLLGDDVSEKKPSPMIYSVAAERMGVDPRNCAVVEDSKIGLQAALGAGMQCFITATPSTKDQDFSGAAVVADSATELSLAQMLPSAMA